MKRKCDEPKCPAEFTGLSGQIGTNRNCKEYCMRHYRDHAKRPPPLPTDVLSNATESTLEGLKGETNG